MAHPHSCSPLQGELPKACPALDAGAEGVPLHVGNLGLARRVVSPLKRKLAAEQTHKQATGREPERGRQPCA